MTFLRVAQSDRVGLGSSWVATDELSGVFGGLAFVCLCSSARYHTDVNRGSEPELEPGGEVKGRL